MGRQRKVLDGLNPEQREVVMHDDGALVVCATAGSGKTESMCRLVARLVEDGVDPKGILATTFTKKAAGEMNERLGRLGCPIGRNGDGARVGTFHSVCLEIIRDGSPWAKWQVDSKDRMRIKTKELLGYKGMNWRDADLTQVLGFISICKNNLVGPEGSNAFMRKQGGGQPPDPRFVQAYTEYEDRRCSEGLITFDDMLKSAVEHLQADADARYRWGGKYSHVIVDEFQDSNLAQYELMKLLSDGSRALVVVGDDDQAIYQWRGAVPEYIVRFEERHRAKLVKMMRNYRSHSEVVERGNQVVKENKDRIEKSGIAERGPGGDVAHAVVTDMDAEAEHVLHEVRMLLADGRRYGDVGVLYRTNAQSRAFEEVFVREKVPHVVVGGQSFWDRREIKDVMAYARLVDCRGDDDAARRAVNAPFRFIGKVTIDKLTRWTAQRGTSFMHAVENAGQVDHRLQSRQLASLGEFRHVVDTATAMDQKGCSPPEVLGHVLRATEYERWILQAEGSDTSENSRISNLKELVRTSGRFKDMREFVAHVDRVMNEVEQLKKALMNGGERPNVVQLMSIHKSKGLEFPVVFLAGASDGILPHARSGNLEEERRLFYVAVTRARDVLRVTSPLTAMVGNKLVEMEVSQFVHEAGLDGGSDH